MEEFEVETIGSKRSGSGMIPKHELSPARRDSLWEDILKQLSQRRLNVAPFTEREMPEESKRTFLIGELGTAKTVLDIYYRRYLRYSLDLQQYWEKEKESILKEIQNLSNKLQSIQEQKRMDIAYALASEPTKKILTLLANKVTVSLEEIEKLLPDSDVIGVIVDLCKSRLANYKSKKLIISSLGIKIAKKLSLTPNE